MNYQVVITSRAEQELYSTADYIAQHSPQAASRWLKGIVKAIQGLSKNPQRYGVARESARFPYEVRQLLYGRRRNHRVVFTIRRDDVIVLSMRHSAERDLDPDDV